MPAVPPRWQSNWLRCKVLPVDWPEPRSFANSAALFLRPEVQGDSVRPGIALYGAATDESHTAAQLGVEPAMTLQSRLIAVQTLNAGRSSRLRIEVRWHRVRFASASSRAAMPMAIRAMHPMERRCWSTAFGYRLPGACRWT